MGKIKATKSPRQDFKNCSMESVLRQKLERFIVRDVIARLLAAGYKLSVDNMSGDDDNVREFETLSKSATEIYSRMFQTDEDYLFVFSADAKHGVWGKGTGDGPGQQVGWVRFIYGNDGWDVISDYSSKFEKVLKDDKLTDKLLAGQFEIVLTPGRAD